MGALVALLEWLPVGREVARGIVGEVEGLRATAVHDVDLEVAVPVGVECNAPAFGREDGARVAGCAVVRQASLARAVSAHLVDLVRPALVAHEGDPAPL